ncbi:MAG TPA: GH1 family beta-glucosidase [Candidatus Acidoferrales bacterium]|nr:GH1 family beta-glucosidase [Candidatus Acidoferrales bacterium]
MKLPPRNSSKRLSRREFLATSAGTAAAFASIGAPDLGLATAQTATSQTKNETPFAKDFLWGAATSAYQIEGAAREDGKGPSVWDEFVRKRGKIRDERTGDIACDFYHRYAEDVAHMREMGLGAFLFSVSWPRVIPGGTGATNPKGLDFYSRLVDALLAAGIAPIVTLFHWDTPVALERRGGWRVREMAGWFADYAAVVTRALSDRVSWWLTINEPRSFIGGAYVEPVQAPGEKLSRRDALRAAHITFLAHGRAVQAIRANARKPVQISYPCDVSPSLPATDSAADIAAAHESTFASPSDHFSADHWWRENAWWLDPVYRGEYPAEAMAALGADAPEIRAGDMETIRQPLDFLGANIYGGWDVRADVQGKAKEAPFPAGFPMTAFGWQVTPDAMYWAPKWLYERYKMPILITENGCSTRDWISLDGRVHDPQRIDFTMRYLQALARAANEGVPLRGYLHWSLLDNFEWQEGYTQRFGMLYVDFPTQERVLKDSARWYARVIASPAAAIQQWPAC